MSELMHEINWSLILTLLLVSAVVAWAGDYFGMKLGRKRLTFLKIRPRYTSRIMSVLTGVIIAFVTLCAVSATIEPVRTALFSMNYVQSQITSLTGQLQENRDSLETMEMQLFRSRSDLREKQEKLALVERSLEKGMASLKITQEKLATTENEMHIARQEQKRLLNENDILRNESIKLKKSIVNLNEKSEQLKKGLKRLREGRIAALAAEILSQTVIETNGKLSEEAVDDAVERLTDSAKSFMAFRTGMTKHELSEPVIDKHSLENLRSTLLNQSGRWLIRLTVVSNAVYGEPVQVRVDAYQTRHIYNKGDMLIIKKVRHGLSKRETEKEVFEALKDLNAKAVRDGVFRDPLTGNVGAVDTNTLMNAFKTIFTSKKDRYIRFVTKDDIYSEGPVRVDCIVK